ncbi:52 kDa repressor of the inhibitor of the protein kinase-like, partial [Aphis craccivora]
KRTNSSLHLFKFPTDPERARSWLNNSVIIGILGNTDLLSKTNLKNRVVCEDHFDDSNFTDERKIRLKKTAVPKNFKEESSDEELHVQTPTKVYTAQTSLSFCTLLKSRPLSPPTLIVSPGK